MIIFPVTLATSYRHFCLINVQARLNISDIISLSSDGWLAMVGVVTDILGVVTDVMLMIMYMLILKFMLWYVCRQIFRRRRIVW